MQNVDEPQTPSEPESQSVQSTPNSSNSSPVKYCEAEYYLKNRRFMSDSSEGEEDSVCEVESFVIDPEYEEVEDPQLEAEKFLLNNSEDPRAPVDPETQARLEALLQAAGLKGIGQLASKDGKHLADPEVLRRLTSSVSCALDEAAAALTRMRSDNNPRSVSEKTSLVEACTDGDVPTVRKLLTEGRSVHETSEEGESLLSLACSAGYFELAQVLLAMHANVEDRGIKGECTPLMEAASAGHLDIVRLLVAHGADVNAQSTSGNTPLMYGCAGGHQDVVKFLLENGANVEDHNENGHTPLMEAASAGHVGLAKILLMHGAGINTHSNEFKESALTLACYKGHLDMVKFLLEAGADQEHKTDEMHTALMEASMDGHVEVARLLLDSGAQVNMPTDSFESPLTLAACGGHVDLAMLLIERGANIEEVNDEGYTPLMEAAREGHEEMVALLLSQGANINAQTDETQETALTLACCGGFTEVADFLIKAGADIELGASTPLMEAAQEGHLELVKYLLENNANVHATTQTGDTALTYACENGHTDVADLLLQYGADLEHESEGGRTPLMKACRAGHLCTVQFLISKGANVRRQTQNNDHTPLSLACAGGHLPVVELLLAHRADPNHKLKDNSTMLIEAAKGGHTNVVQLLLDYPHSMLLNQQGAAQATNLSMLPGQVGSRDSPPLIPDVSPPVTFFTPPPNLTSNDFSPAVLQEVPEAVHIMSQDETQSTGTPDGTKPQSATSSPGHIPDVSQLGSVSKSRPSSSLTQKNRNSFVGIEFEDQDVYSSSTKPLEFLPKEEGFMDSNSSFIDYVKNRKKQMSGSSSQDEGGSQKKQQILEELHRVDREFLGKQQSQQQTSTSQPMGNHLLLSQYSMSQDQCSQSPAASVIPPHTLNIDIAMQQQQQQQQGLNSGVSTSSVFTGPNLQVHNAFYTGATCLQPSGVPLKLAVSSDTGTFTPNQSQPAFYFTPLNTSAVPLTTATPSTAPTQPIKFQNVTSHAEVSQNTAISDRPKAKPVSKKEGKNLRKQQQFQPALFGQQQQIFTPQVSTQQTSPQGTVVNQATHTTAQQTEKTNQSGAQLTVTDALNVQGLDLDALDQDSFVIKDDAQENLITASILQQFHNTSQINSIRTAFVGSTSYNTTLDEPIITLPDLTGQNDVSRVEYFAVPTNGTQSVQVQHALYPYEHYLQAMPTKDLTGALYQAGFQAGITMMQQQLACPSASSSETLTTTTVVPTTVAAIPGSSNQQFVPTSPSVLGSVPSSCSHAVGPSPVQSAHHCQVPCSQHHQPLTPAQPQTTPINHQVQAATQTQIQAAQTASSGPIEPKKQVQKSDSKKKGRLLFRHNSNQQASQGTTIQPSQAFQIDPNSAITQYGVNQQCSSATVPPTNYCMDVDSETESNHDTALTLACAGGHEELVELLLNRGADIEHRDKKGFTPLILAATAGHEKVVEILLNHNADIEAQSERTKDTPLSLACSGGRYEVVELLLNRNANKEHRNVSDYTPLSLAASGGYVNIIKLLLQHGAEINSRTGSKLGISPLMLAAMNGHTAAVKLLLDMGSDINAQIETNRNTALTLACFQGRHEVVSLLLDRKANVEHRAKTGLTPLMEAASGGYVEVGRVLLDKGADVNATPVPSSRDTALTIAADKGHIRFVELLLCRGAAVEVKNKKGNSPLWLAANGGHLSVVELLYNLTADIDSQDNRKVSCLMAAFRKGHTKVVKWMVNHVTQFPSDQEMIRYIATVSDKELLEKCQECVNIIRAAKETQAAKANKNASILLEELDMEKNREESKKAAAARRRERKKKKKLEKKEEKRKLHEENKKNEEYDEKDDKKSDDDADKVDDEDAVPEVNDVSIRNGEHHDKEEGDSGIDANSQGSCSSNEVKTNMKRKDKKKKKPAASQNTTATAVTTKNENENRESKSNNKSTVSTSTTTAAATVTASADYVPRSADKVESAKSSRNSFNNSTTRKTLMFESTRHPAEREDFEATGNETYTSSKSKKPNAESEALKNTNSTSPKQAGKREEGWKEVVRKSSVQTVSTSETGVKKISVPLHAISRVIGRGGCNINAIRAATGAHIEVEKQCKGQGERTITIKGSADVSKQAHSLIAVLIKDPDADILQMLPKPKTNTPATNSNPTWEKTQPGNKKPVAKVTNTATSVTTTTTTQQKVVSTASTSTVTVYTRFPTLKYRSPASTTTVTRTSTAPPRLASQADKNCLQSRSVAITHPTTVISSTRGTAKVITTTATQTFAAKLTETSSAQTSISANQTASCISKPRTTPGLVPPISGQSGPVSPQASTSSGVQGSPKHARPVGPPTGVPQNALPATGSFNHAPGKPPFAPAPIAQPGTGSLSEHVMLPGQARSNTPVTSLPVASSLSSNQDVAPEPSVISTPQEYSLFNSIPQPMWRPENESQKPVNFAAVTGGGNSQTNNQPKFMEQEPPPVVDASKAPGYRGTAVCSPVSSKTSSSSTTPPTMQQMPVPGYQSFSDPKTQTLPLIGGMHSRPVSQSSQNDISSSHYFNNDLQSRNMQHMSHSEANLYKGVSSFTDSSNMLNMSAAEAPLLQQFMPSSATLPHLGFSQSQQQVSQPAVTMSRLNPKAPDFSSTLPHHSMAMKQQQQPMYNGFPMSPNYAPMNKPVMPNYPPRNSAPPNQVKQPTVQSWMVPPLTAHQVEMMSGMSLTNLVRVSSDMIENGGELGAQTNSPSMSPSSHNMHPPDVHSYLEDRKQPQPIGTERARKYPNANCDWMGAPNDTKIMGNMNRWNTGIDRNNFMTRNQMYSDDISHLMDNSYSTTPIQLDTTPQHVFNGANMPPFLMQQQMAPNLRNSHDFPGSADQIKLEPSWDSSRPNMADHQDKQHGGWSLSNSKWQ